MGIASLLVFIGFGAGRWIDRNGVPFEPGKDGTAEMGLLNPFSTHIRDIQPRENNSVRIIVDQVHEREITGRIQDDSIRQLLLAATKDPTDPGIRVDSVEILTGQNGSDVRDALLYSVQHDPNAAVRLKALDGLRQFVDDPATRDTLKFVLQHDENAGVRSEAIDVLAPANGKMEYSPALANTLQEIIRSEQDDDYVRTRCLQMLQEMKASMDVY
jgi:hypothetical protein